MASTSPAAARHRSKAGRMGALIDPGAAAIPPPRAVQQLPSRAKPNPHPAAPVAKVVNDRYQPLLTQNIEQLRLSAGAPAGRPSAGLYGARKPPPPAPAPRTSTHSAGSTAAATSPRRKAPSMAANILSRQRAKQDKGAGGRGQAARGRTRGKVTVPEEKTLEEQGQGRPREPVVYNAPKRSALAAGGGDNVGISPPWIKRRRLNDGTAAAWSSAAGVSQPAGESSLFTSVRDPEPDPEDVVNAAIRSVGVKSRAYVEGAPAAAAADTAPPPPRGLQNTGNTCYMNAVLSALVRLPAFADAVQATTRLYRAKGVRSGLLPFVADVVRGVLTGGSQGICPDGVKRSLAAQRAIFTSNEQQDAHEFLLSLFEQLHNEILGVKLKARPRTGHGEHSRHAAAEVDADAGTPGDCLFPSQEAEGGVDVDADVEDSSEGGAALGAPGCEDCPIEFSASLVRRLFEGKVRTQYVCRACRTATWAPDYGSEFSVITVPLRDRVAKLADLIKACFARDHVERTCEVCAARSRKTNSKPAPAHSYQQHVITALPHYFVAHLNRFVAVGAGAADVDGSGIAVPFIRKALHKVLPPAHLNLDPYASAKGLAFPPVDELSFSSTDGAVRATRPIDAGLRHSTSALYALRSVVHHLGATVDAGHYVADVLDGGEWWRADDAVMTRTAPPWASATDTAYIVIYERVAGL